MKKLVFVATLVFCWLAVGPRVSEAQAPRWTIFTTQSPTETLDAAPGWEVGTRFTSSKPGRIIGFRFWRAAGETGSNYGKLWTDSGTRLKLSKAFPSGTGWVQIILDNPVTISINTVYRVSVNTNSKQVKKGGAYAVDGPISQGPLYSDGGYYGQPIDAMPTSSSASMFFVDVIFEEFVPPPPRPDLYISYINPFDGINVNVTVCNQGTANADASSVSLFHSRSPLPSGPVTWQYTCYIPMPAIAVNQCATRGCVSTSPAGTHNNYTGDADVFNEVVESTETNNRWQIFWDHY
ncbi:MAG TPA: DUF4082 domain-containing protein [Thermoanaerobaculia bacterium]|jgi:hypothetical protein|nr:DUF4082 domain-containing protein [Thermoanaerobaculia bacterium]